MNPTTHRAIRESARDIEVLDDVDVLVVGGGPAGVCAVQKVVENTVALKQ